MITLTPILLEVTLPADLSAIAAARSAAAEACVRHGFTALAEPVRLCTSELVTNAVRHTHTRQVGLRIERTDTGAVRIAVTDDSPHPPRHTHRLPNLAAVSGRGMHIVANIATAIGHHRGPGNGKTVWCELRSEVR